MHTKKGVATTHQHILRCLTQLGFEARPVARSPRRNRKLAFEPEQTQNLFLYLVFLGKQREGPGILFPAAECSVRPLAHNFKVFICIHTQTSHLDFRTSTRFLGITDDDVHLKGRPRSIRLRGSVAVRPTPDHKVAGSNSGSSTFVVDPRFRSPVFLFLFALPLLFFSLQVYSLPKHSSCGHACGRFAFTYRKGKCLQSL